MEMMIESSHSTIISILSSSLADIITVTAIIELQPGQKVSDSLLSLCCMNTKAELLQLQLTPIKLPDANFINAKKLEIEKKAKPS